MADQPDPNQQRLQDINVADLTAFLRIALGSQTITIRDWKYEMVTGGIAGGRFDTFIYRFLGQAEDLGTASSWSMIVKVLRARQGELPDDPQYWKREGEIYRHGLLDDLAGGMGAPRCFGVVEYPDEACWVWMEDIHDDIGPVWPLEHYRIVARHMGQFNGDYLTHRALPSEAWLSSSWFRKMAGLLTPEIPQALEALSTLAQNGIFPGDAVDQFTQVWAERDLYLNTLDTLPQTLCHLDAFRRNLVARKNLDNEYQTIGVDWAYAGKSALGADIAVCELVGFVVCETDARGAFDFKTMLLENYLNGLGDVGWQDDPEIVRLGFSTSIVAKYLELVTTVPWAADDSNQEWLESFIGHPFQDIQEQYAGMFRFVIAQADEVRRAVHRLE